MHLNFLRKVFAEAPNNDALIWRDQGYSYGWLLQALDSSIGQLLELGVARASVVSLEADFSPTSVATLLALIEHECIVVPLTTSVENHKPEFLKVSEVEYRIVIDDDDQISCAATGQAATHELYAELQSREHPGLVLFSSGSTGKSKAAVHDLAPMLEKFHVRRHSLRTITFLLFDHIGGFNTLMYNLSNGGCVISVNERQPDKICKIIARHKAELLPTSPTFLNLLLVSRAYERHDLSSLGLVTYGTEVMPESTLKRFHEVFPEVKLQQTYGLSEVGILRSKSKSSDSLWVKIGGEGFETRIVDGLLEIKAQSAMLGYLNAPSPFTDDGWFKTGDAVEVDGDYMRILGRRSEIVNVGGEKVYPAEVESVLQLIEGVEEVTVSGEPHPITGQIIRARVRLNTDETLAEFRKRMRKFCSGQLAAFKVPQKVEIVEERLHGERYKKMRRG